MQIRDMGCHSTLLNTLKVDQNVLLCSYFCIPSAEITDNKHMRLNFNIYFRLIFQNSKDAFTSLVVCAQSLSG
jgi:hypothetical protein